MPIEGLPDPEQHRLCVRCGRWHHPDEGSEIDVRSTAPGRILPVIRFVCRRRRLRIRIILFGSLALLLLLALLARLLGIL